MAGNTTTWVYDSLGRVIEETNELSDTRYYVYNAAGLLVEKTDRNGRVTQYEYDSLYRLTEENWLDSQQQVVYTISYTHDAAGNLLSASDPAASYEYVYDALGRLTEETQTIAGLTPVIVFSSQFDARGRRTELAASTGGTADFVNAYQHDNLGRLTVLTQSGAQGGNAVAEKRVDFTYDAASRYDTIARYADLAGTQLVAAGTYTFDPLGRLTSLVYTDSAPSTIRSFGWTYDAAGNLTSHDSDIAAEDVTSYTHDDTNQLTDADYTTGADESYEYDSNGNRVLVDGTDSYTTGTNNRLISDGYYRYEYDDNGNLIARYVDADSSQSLNAGDTDITEYTWDHRNRLTDVAHKAVFGGSVDWTAEYIYDAFNRRVGSLYDLDGDSDLDREERYVWDGRNVVLDFIDSDGAGGAASLELTTRYLWGQAVDQLFAQETVDDGGAEDVLWPVTDNLGSVRSMVNYLGQITATYSYDTFGNVTVQAGAITDTRYLFTCQEYDVATGFYYYDARIYDPATARFISEDPSGLRPDVNPYRYVGNAPLTNTDPSGLEDISNRNDFIIENAMGFFDPTWEDFAEEMGEALGMQEGYENKWSELHEIKETFKTAGEDDIVIFYGHTATNKDKSKWALDMYGGKYHEEDIIKDINENPGKPALLMIMGCESTSLGKNIQKGTNIRIVVTTNRTLSQAEAAKLMRIFFEELKKGKTIQEAADAANAAMPSISSGTPTDGKMPESAKLEVHAQDPKDLKRTLKDLVKPKKCE